MQGANSLSTSCGQPVFTKFTTFNNTGSRVVNCAIIEAVTGVSLTIEREKNYFPGTGTGSVFFVRGSLLRPSAFELCVPGLYRRRY